MLTIPGVDTEIGGEGCEGIFITPVGGDGTG